MGGDDSSPRTRRLRSDTLRKFVDNVFDDEPVPVMGGEEAESELLSSSMVFTDHDHHDSETLPSEGRLRGVSTFSSLSNAETRPRGLSSSITVTDEGVESMVKWAGGIFDVEKDDGTPTPTSPSFSLPKQTEQTESPEMLQKRVSDALASVKAARLEKKRQKSILIP